nr:immunoglobulin heavy chain junction region [Macaca mulatta]MOW76706.1 immunoglobulin heavy chain junction region [Macaca mulatta]MOW77060.1 immunoglobulin heavy chain junction region [Macaca mulatta]MOW77250.1 immunoglobulin heavy chain junction region [Macaca mulatta]MOW78432.1 immunoglobulin heavy chain junction region [Macaca mulatta]
CAREQDDYVYYLWFDVW